MKRTFAVSLFLAAATLSAAAVAAPQCTCAGFTVSVMAHCSTR